MGGLKYFSSPTFLLRQMLLCGMFLPLKISCALVYLTRSCDILVHIMAEEFLIFWRRAMAYQLRRFLSVPVFPKGSAMPNLALTLNAAICGSHCENDRIVPGLPWSFDLDSSLPLIEKNGTLTCLSQLDFTSEP